MRKLLILVVLFLLVPAVYGANYERDTGYVDGNKIHYTYTSAVSLSSATVVDIMDNGKLELISNYAPYAVTLTSVTARNIDGTSANVQIEIRDYSTTLTAGTDIWSSAVTTSSMSWTGGAFSDSTLSANQSLWLDVESKSGDLYGLLIKITHTVD